MSCTSGIDVSLAKNNKKDGIRCALLADSASARYARENENTNVMALGTALTAELYAREIVDAWLVIFPIVDKRL